MYQGEQIQAMRETRMGKLVLGSGFLWSDLVCYSIGSAIGLLLESSVWVNSRVMHTRRNTEKHLMKKGKDV
ncbi:DUF2809 domain-containing protein [Maribacter sp. 2-571]|uniref:ribosomal maturation YjgA family protein n=1 Tax=Maribacter sp. 2-571 TaxID=3417569 RepID=UPI003D32C64D